MSIKDKLKQKLSEWHSMVQQGSENAIEYIKGSSNNTTSDFTTPMKNTAQSNGNVTQMPNKVVVSPFKHITSNDHVARKIDYSNTGGKRKKRTRRRKKTKKQHKKTQHKKTQHKKRKNGKKSTRKLL